MMMPRESGGWVRYSDVVTVLAELDRLEKERDEAVQRTAGECIKTCQAEKIPDVDIFSRSVNKAIQNCIDAISEKYGLDK